MVVCGLLNREKRTEKENTSCTPVEREYNAMNSSTKCKYEGIRKIFENKLINTVVAQNEGGISMAGATSASQLLP